MINFLFKIKKLTAAALGAGCFFLLACENDMTEVRNLTKKVSGVEEGVQIESYYSQDGRMKAKLTAPYMKRLQTDTPYIEFPNSLHVDFYDSTLQVESKLSALYGKYRENENKVFLKDSVMVYNIKGDTLRCEELWWDRQQEKFYTDKAVRIYTRSPKRIVYGIGMEAGQDFSWRTIYKAAGQAEVQDSTLQ
jgi:LPS export ABC transporter protein LptC